MGERESLSLQVTLVRQMQAREGQAVCFATKISNECDNSECCWRHDCFDEALDLRLAQAARQ
ncbi:MAG TPA: hypothetical protein VK149_00675 [Sideroxyarcus sp.]|nr:hypothetical protein [Sideroxyarcus sp.]